MESATVTLDQGVGVVSRYWLTRGVWEKAGDALLVYVLFTHLVSPIYISLYRYGIVRSLQFVIDSVKRYVFSWVFRIPSVRAKVQKEVNETRVSLEKQLIVQSTKVQQFKTIPSKGLSREAVLEQLDGLNDLKSVAWDEGKVSGAVYHGGDDLIKLQTEAYHKFAVANQLHPDLFPGVRQMESEVVSMVLNLFHAPPDACGTTSSGGTESLLLACLAARERARSEKGITQFEIVAPKTIHAAVFKAAEYFNMKLLLADLDPETFKVDIQHVKRLVGKNTAIILGSAPNFPYGTVDDISALSDIAIAHDIPLHVDCCLGSFVIAYYEKAMKKPLPFQFDFAVPGVTSISCDTHKYGFAPKGSSVIMYRNPEYRKYQYYITSEWVGGIYGSPTLAGSRPGSLTVGAWATMVHLGDEGYTQLVRSILENMAQLRSIIESDIPELTIIGDPLLSVVAFKSDVINVHALGDMLSKNYGWHLSSLQQPAALHIAATVLTRPAAELAKTLQSCVRECVAVLERDGPGAIKSDTAQLYGVAESVSTQGVVADLVRCFLDCLYKTERTP